MKWLVISAVVALLLPALINAFKRKSALPSDKPESIYVIDGDTLNIDGKRIRLFGIDAPEMGQSQGGLARKALVDFIRGHELKLIPVKTDKYGRLVARVIRDDGEDLADLMVSRGFALASHRYTRAYTNSQIRARHMGCGFWADGYVQDGAAYRKMQ